jgi:hypothetical protein
MKNELKHSGRFSAPRLFRTGALVVVLLTSIQPSETKADLVYAQPLATNDIGGFLSTNASGFGFISADNFNISTTSTVSEVTWIGSSIIRGADAGNPANYLNPANDYDAFEIRFYSSTGPAGSTTSEPSTLLYDQVVSLANSHQTAVSGTTNFTYDAILPTSFVVSAGVQYWFSVQALATNPTSTTNGAFLWGFGQSGNLNEVTDELSTTTPWDFHNSVNLGFTLTSLPEPSSLTHCVIAGAIGLAVARVRRKRAGG